MWYNKCRAIAIKYFSLECRNERGDLWKNLDEFLTNLIIRLYARKNTDRHSNFSEVTLINGIRSENGLNLLHSVYQQILLYRQKSPHYIILTMFYHPLSSWELSITFVWNNQVGDVNLVENARILTWQFWTLSLLFPFIRPVCPKSIKMHLIWIRLVLLYEFFSIQFLHDITRLV